MVDLLAPDWPNAFGFSEKHVPGDSTPWFHAVAPDQ